MVAWILEHGKHPELFSMIAWTVWTQRNQIRTVQQHCTNDQLAQIAKERLEEYQAIRLAATIALLQSPSQRQTWQAPPAEVFKVNCDGAVFSETNKSGLGVVVWNNNGQVVVSLSQQLNQAYQPIEVEAMTAIGGLEFASELGLDRVIIKGDCSTVMTGLKL